MTTPVTPELLSMARNIAAMTKVGVPTQAILRGDWDGSPVVQAAIAAIQNTTALARDYVERQAQGADPIDVAGGLHRFKHLTDCTA